MIQKHPDSFWHWGVYFYPTLIVLEQTHRIRKLQTPGFGIVSQFSVRIASGSVNPFVGDSNRNSSIASPLHLPVRASGQTLGTQDLSPAVEPLGVIRVRLRLVFCCDLFVFSRKMKEGVCSVGV